MQLLIVYIYIIFEGIIQSYNIYIYICMVHICMCVYLYIYLFIYLFIYKENISIKFTLP